MINEKGQTMPFPYISQVHVHDCYTYQNLDIPQKPFTELKHIILTGKNGSGKTTILSRIANQISYLQNEKPIGDVKTQIKHIIAANPTHSHKPIWEEQLLTFTSIDLFYLGEPEFLKTNTDDYIFSFFRAHRRVELNKVDTVTKEDAFVAKLKEKGNAENFTASFKQYLVNKKVYEAFDFMNSKQENIKESQKFFDNLKNTLRILFRDDSLELEFIQESFEFYLNLSNSRRMTFNQLSEGFSAFLSIIVDLTMRVDLFRKSKNDYSLEPEGIVLIDEPETHFHLSMQYELLPLISSLFPKIQLIIATHSPAIISSLKNAVVYDLTSQSEVSDWLLGSSYSELMISHFGLENEFSPIADKILLDVDNAIREKNSPKLKSILIENLKYLTPSLKLEIESQIIKLESRQ